MVTLYQNGSLQQSPGAGRQTSYGSYIEPDTTIPPKAHPVLSEISVNGVAIAEADILAEAQHHPAETPGAALLAAARALVVRQLLVQEARRLGIVADPQDEGEGRREAAEEALIRCLIEREVHAPCAKPEECRRFYENNPARFRSETIHEARHILLAAAPADKVGRVAAKATAEAVRTMIACNPGGFAAAAAEYSDCPSGKQGGNLGQLTRGSTVAEFEQALDAMEEGTLSPHPVESRFGFHVILLERRIQGASLPFEQVRERIAGWLEAASWSRAVSQYISVLAGRAEIAGIAINEAEGPLLQ